MQHYFHEVWMVLLELSPWLLFGMMVAGLLHVFLPPDFIRKHLGGKGFASVIKASLLGVPMPLCSCSVIPTAIGLKKDGASNGASISFMISTPQTGVDSIAVSASFLGWPFAIFKVLSAFVTGIIGGFLVDATDKEAEVEEAPIGCATADRRPEGFWPKMKEAVVYGINDLLYMIWGWLLIGVLISALISTLVPPGKLQGTVLGGGFLAMLLMLLVSLPLYVCATSSVPIAAALVTAGMPTGAALVFLMAGPASNVATLGAVYHSFGKRVLGIYLAVVSVGSIGLGYLFQSVIGPQTVKSGDSHVMDSPLAVAAAIFLLVCLAVFAVRDLRHWLNKRGERTAEPAADSLELTVQGMTCQDCVRKVETALRQDAGVSSVSVSLEDAKAVVYGSKLDAEALRRRIRDAGFSSG